MGDKTPNNTGGMLTSELTIFYIDRLETLAKHGAKTGKLFDPSPSLTINDVLLTDEQTERRPDVKKLYEKVHTKLKKTFTPEEHEAALKQAVKLYRWLNSEPTIKGESKSEKTDVDISQHTAQHDAHQPSAHDFNTLKTPDAPDVRSKGLEKSKSGLEA